MGPLNKTKKVKIMEKCCSRVHHVEVDGEDYSYVVKHMVPDCNLTPLCQKRRALIEIAPKKYAKFYSDEDITPEMVKEFIKGGNT